MNTSNETRPQPGQLEIAKRAYELWEREGRPQGRDQHYWFTAEAALRMAPPISAINERPVLSEPKGNGETRKKAKTRKSFASSVPK
jgi:hypothetical protein